MVEVNLIKTNLHIGQSSWQEIIYIISGKPNLWKTNCIRLIGVPLAPESVLFGKASRLAENMDQKLDRLCFPSG